MVGGVGVETDTVIRDGELERADLLHQDGDMPCPACLVTFCNASEQQK